MKSGVTKLYRIEHLEVNILFIHWQQEIHDSLHIFLVNSNPKIHFERLLIQLDKTEVENHWLCLDEVVHHSYVDGHSNVVAGRESNRNRGGLQCWPWLRLLVRDVANCLVGNGLNRIFDIGRHKLLVRQMDVFDVDGHRVRVANCQANIDTGQLRNMRQVYRLQPKAVWIHVSPETGDEHSLLQ